jgi:hypothetical protein
MGGGGSAKELGDYSLFNRNLLSGRRWLFVNEIKKKLKKITKQKQKKGKEKDHIRLARSESNEELDPARNGVIL